MGCIPDSIAGKSLEELPVDEVITGDNHPPIPTVDHKEDPSCEQES
jgi:hypothetical protein